MFHLIRRAAAWLARQLLPARGAHRLHPEPTTPARSSRPHRPDPYAWPDDGPLLRPYVLNAEEWARRRRETVPSAVGAAP